MDRKKLIDEEAPLLGGGEMPPSYHALPGPGEATVGSPSPSPARSSSRSSSRRSAPYPFNFSQSNRAPSAPATPSASYGPSYGPTPIGQLPLLPVATVVIRDVQHDYDEADRRARTRFFSALAMGLIVYTASVYLIHVKWSHLGLDQLFDIEWDQLGASITGAVKNGIVRFDKWESVAAKYVVKFFNQVKQALINWH